MEICLLGNNIRSRAFNPLFPCSCFSVHPCERTRILGTTGMWPYIDRGHKLGDIPEEDEVAAQGNTSPEIQCISSHFGRSLEKGLHSAERHGWEMLTPLSSPSVQSILWGSRERQRKQFKQYFCCNHGSRKDSRCPWCSR